MYLVIKKKGISTMKVRIQKISCKDEEVCRAAPTWAIWATYSRCSWEAEWVAWAVWAEVAVQAVGVEWGAKEIHFKALIWDKEEMARSPHSDLAEI